MSDFYQVSSAPHVRAKDSTSRIMLYVIIGLLPTTIYGIYNFGLQALLVLLVTITSCVLSELVFDLITKRPLTIKDLSSVVTGLLLGLNLPASIPLWEAALGGIFAIIVVKMLFGGLGQNFMNPALGARCFLLTAFAADMTNFTCDAYSSATPLTTLANKGLEKLNTMKMLYGNTNGCIGETSMFAIVIGAIILIMLGVINLRIPASYLLSFLVVMTIYMLAATDYGFSPQYLAAQLCGGGLMLGAFFMATDYVTSPITPVGQIIFGICCGVLTAIFRCFGSNTEGVSYAIIISNLLVPLIEKATVPKASGIHKDHKASKLSFNKEKRQDELEKKDAAASDKKENIEPDRKANIDLKAEADLKEKDKAATDLESQTVVEMEMEGESKLDPAIDDSKQNPRAEESKQDLIADENQNPTEEEGKQDE